MTASDWIALSALILAAIGGLFSLIQWRKSVAIKRAEFVEAITQKLHYDKDILKTFYMIDYSEFKYDERFHSVGNPIQVDVDILLSTLDYLCYLLDRRLINENDIVSDLYILKRVCLDIEIQCYLWNLHHFARSTDSKTYGHLIIFLVEKVFSSMALTALIAKLFETGFI